MVLCVCVGVSTVCVGFCVCVGVCTVCVGFHRMLFGMLLALFHAMLISCNLTSFIMFTKCHSILSTAMFLEHMLSVLMVLCGHGVHMLSVLMVLCGHGEHMLSVLMVLCGHGVHMLSVLMVLCGHGVHMHYRFGACARRSCT